MKIGIIIYSKSGHTLSVALKLKEKLSASGHTATLEKLEASGSIQNTVLKTKPAIDGFDALVFGAPIWGGRMAPAMRMYLEQIASLKGKKTVCFVTQALFGGNRTIESMKKICESKGAIVCGSGSIRWMSFGRKRKISDMTDRLSGLF